MMGNITQLAVPWKLDSPKVPNNFEMACSQLRNTEKRLLRHPPEGEEYKQTIVSYLDKGYVRNNNKKEREPPSSFSGLSFLESDNKDKNRIRCQCQVPRNVSGA